MLLRSKPAISVLVGEGVNARIYPDIMNQIATLPAIVYEENGGESVEHLAGGAGVCHAVVHVYAYGRTRREANVLAEVIKDELRPYRGAIGNHFVNGITATRHRESGVDASQDKGDSHRYWTRRVYDIWHTEIA